jgi:hypothetical protein
MLAPLIASALDRQIAVSEFVAGKVERNSEWRAAIAVTLAGLPSRCVGPSAP